MSSHHSPTKLQPMKHSFRPAHIAQNPMLYAGDLEQNKKDDAGKDNTPVS